MQELKEIGELLFKGSGRWDNESESSDLHVSLCSVAEPSERIMTRGYRMTVSVSLRFPDVIVEATWFPSTKTDLINKYDDVLAYVPSGATGLCFWPGVTLKPGCMRTGFSFLCSRKTSSTANNQQKVKSSFSLVALASV